MTTSTPVDVLAALRRTGRNLQRLDARRDAVLAERNRLIIQALDAGKNQQQIADALGISRARAHQLTRAALKEQP